VLSNVLLGAQPRVRSRFSTSILRLPSVAREERALHAEAHELLSLLGLSDLAHRRTSELPYGTLKRVELARALMARPKLLMLDEPAAGLTQAEVSELAEVVSGLAGRFELTVLLVEHHMGMVMSLCDRVIVLDFGRKLSEGRPDEVARDPAVIEAYLGEAPQAASQSEEVTA
jgi:branched-chain amino acid transport system ATP-binding protein